MKNYTSIIDYIQRKSVECLNENSKFPISNALFQSNLETYCSSLDDHELFIRFYFTQPMRLSSISFRLSEEDVKQGYGPKLVKLFVNCESYSLYDAESEDSTQEIKISKSQLITGEPIELRFVKFQNVSFLQIYVSENHGAEQTRIGRINIYGEQGNYVDITKWKAKDESEHA
ncbi:hypothetical protein cand_004670 [Cryptosporidium andersoni]|uniref:PITH domain-containing protein n=1 Tax=Cryptosporidium andersoni TaxID=117008 RepID=A0A1J4MLH3_9CRYT|nr:hypothetical protein cand_004670 [Cryptosporidium andersoni]